MAKQRMTAVGDMTSSFTGVCTIASTVLFVLVRTSVSWYDEFRNTLLLLMIGGRPKGNVAPMGWKNLPPSASVARLDA